MIEGTKMRQRRTAGKLALLAALTAVGIAGAACGGGSGPASGVKVDAKPSFAADSTMANLSKAGRITIGVKYDQPGIGFKDPATGQLEGFDIEIAKIVAAKMGIAPEKITFKETISKNREPFLEQGVVDLVIASYSITDSRKEKIDFAGPYYVTGQQLLVRKTDTSISGPQTLSGKKVCSVTGSTSIKTVTEKYGAKPVPFGTYTECVQQLLNGSVDAVTTDGAILLGYAAQQPDKMKVVGEAFSVEKYGIGLKKGDTAFRTFLNDAIETSYRDGTWKKAFEATLGKSGVATPTPPPVERY